MFKNLNYNKNKINRIFSTPILDESPSYMVAHLFSIIFFL